VRTPKPGVPQTPTFRPSDLYLQTPTFNLI
jgi:hypothetical protein